MRGGGKRRAVLIAPVALIGLALSSRTAAYARPCPRLLDLNGEIKAEVVGVRSTDEVRGVGGNQMRVGGKRLNMFRIAVVTIKITKPINRGLSVACADFTLHYYHGNETEVAPAEGMSSFSTAQAEVRPITLPRMSGPGFTKQTTGPRAVRAKVVYIDIIFGYMEPDTREVWVCVGRPITTRPYVTRGWTPN